MKWKTHPELFLLTQIEVGFECLGSEAGEELEEPRDELCRQLLRLHATLCCPNYPLVVAHMLQHQNRRIQTRIKTLIKKEKER